MTDFKLGMGL